MSETPTPDRLPKPTDLADISPLTEEGITTRDDTDPFSVHGTGPLNGIGERAVLKVTVQPTSDPVRIPGLADMVGMGPETAVILGLDFPHAESTDRGMTARASRAIAESARHIPEDAGLPLPPRRHIDISTTPVAVSRKHNRRRFGRR